MCAREEERRIAPQKSLRCVGSTPLYLGHFVYQFHLKNTRRIKRALLIIRTYSLAAVRAAFRHGLSITSMRSLHEGGYVAPKPLDLSLRSPRLYSYTVTEVL